MRKIMFGTHVLVDLDELADKYTKEEIDNMISTVFVYKGTVATTGDLSSIENPKVGDCWNVEADGNNYAWNGSEWDKLSGTVDLSNYYTKTQVDAIKSALELQIQDIKSLPTGGTEGQVLTKNSDTDGDASWKTLEVNEVTSLWTNSSPTSSLAPGNITLNSSTDDYDSIEFIFTDYIETNNYLSVIVPKGKNVNLSCNLYSENLMHYCSRTIAYVNATTYDVKDGYNTSNTDPNSPVLYNDCCVLQEIRGHKVIKSS